MKAKNQNTACTLCLLVLMALCLPARAGWTEDMRITDRGHEIYPQIIARNDTLHVGWQQMANIQQISYIRSRDGGYTWEGLIDLVENGHSGSRSDISLSNEHVIVGWKDRTIDYPYFINLSYSVSTHGDSWSNPEYIYSNGYDGSMAFAITHSSDSIYVTYLADSSDSTGYLPIIFLYSPDLGQTWSEDYTFTHTSEGINGLLIKKCGGSLYIVWTAVPYPELAGYEAMAVVSHDGGESWSDRIMLSVYGLPYAQLPCLACNESTDELAVGWMDNNYPGDLFLRITADGGDTWEPEIHVTDHNAISRPNIEFVGDTLWATWVDRSFAETWQLGFSKSIDRGLSWNPIERLTYSEGYANRPWLSYDNGRLHLVWDDDRPPHGGDEIYYKRWEPETGIDENNSIPNNYQYLSSYPNPFNSTALLSYSNVEGGDIYIYNIIGKLIRKLDCGGGKEGKIIWDATDNSGKDVSSGVYFAKVKGSNTSKPLKLIYLK